jgi:hypothetical protein
VAYFGFRDRIASGTFYSSGVAAATTKWYRLTVTLDDASQSASMEVTNLTDGGIVVDLNGAAAGTAFSNAWPANVWISPTNFSGTIGRASTTLLIDNLAVLQWAVSPPPVSLLATVNGSNLQLTWPMGTLLEATNVAGPWTTNPASSPYFAALMGPAKFYRVLVQ